MTNLIGIFLKKDTKMRKEIIRFSIGGALVGATDYGFYYILTRFVSFSLAKAIAFTCAGIIAYLLNKYWTFEHNLVSFAEVARYTFINVLGLGINVFTNQAMLNWSHNNLLFGLLFSSLLTGLFTFICFKWWVFRVLLKKL